MEFRKALKRKSKKTEDTVLMYSLLIALTFFPYDEATTAIKKLDLSTLDWGPWFSDFFHSTATITQVVTLKPQIITKASIVETNSSASVNRITLNVNKNVEEASNATL